MEYTPGDSRRSGKIEDMRRVCQHWIEGPNGQPIIAGSSFNRCFLRRLSIYVTWAFVTLGVRAHTATLLMILAGLAGIVTCIPHSIELTLLGGFCYFLFDLLDAVDGEIARWNDSSTTKGLYLDQISHVLIEYPSLGVPALHCYLWTRDDLYLVLAATAMLSAVMGRTFREIMFRINAEALVHAEPTGPTEADMDEQPSGLFVTCCNYLKTVPLTAFPIVKARIVHMTTVVAILLSYAGSAHLLVFVSWFYAVYCTTRSLVQMPYYFSHRVVDVPHTKPIAEYKWPI